jgi:hypothetical protein
MQRDDVEGDRAPLQLGEMVELGHGKLVMGVMQLRRRGPGAVDTFRQGPRDLHLARAPAEPRWIEKTNWREAELGRKGPVSAPRCAMTASAAVRLIE